MNISSDCKHLTHYHSECKRKKKKTGFPAYYTLADGCKKQIRVL